MKQAAKQTVEEPASLLLWLAHGVPVHLIGHVALNSLDLLLETSINHHEVLLHAAVPIPRHCKTSCSRSVGENELETTPGLLPCQLPGRRHLGLLSHPS